MENPQTALKKSVAFILDNPLRDLPGIAIVALRLAQLGTRVHIIPMYDQVQHIADLKPDLVVLNFIRQENSHLIHAYYEMGASVAAIETEGGVFINPEEIVAGKSELLKEFNRISLYMVWGRRLFDEFKMTIAKKTPVKIKLTGTPRTDFIGKPPNIDTDFDFDSPYLLITTNNQLVNSRFNSFEQELSNARRVLIAKDDLWEQRHDAYMKTFKDVLAMLKNTFDRNKSLKFVLRPHPYEDIITYEKAFKAYPNVEIRLEGTIYDWINNAKGVLQLNSSTGIEASMAGVPSILPNWLLQDATVVNSVTEVSYLAQDQDHLDALLQHCWRNDPSLDGFKSRRDEIQLRTETLIKEWFHRIDGKSHERVAEAIYEMLAYNRTKRWKPAFRLTILNCYEFLRRSVGTIYFLPEVRRSDKLSRRSRKSFNAKQTEKILNNFFGTTENVSIQDKTLFPKNVIYSSNRVTLSSTSISSTELHQQP